MTSARTVAARLRDEVDAGRLQFDPIQQLAAERLDKLAEDMAGGSPGLIERVRGRLSRFGADAARPPLRGVYLWGGVGRGKTMLMDYFVAAVPQAARSHFYHFMRDVHVGLGGIKGREDPLEIVAQRLSERSRIICLDEFFVSDIADAMILSGLFDGLFRRGVSLVATSNLPPEALYKDGLQRPRFLPAIELIRAHVDVLHLEGGTDYRLRQLEKAPTYLAAHEVDSQQRLHSRFVALAGGAQVGPTTLNIEGRELHALASGPGMLWFDFRELCEGPRSQNDYIDIAHLCHTLFISDIPLFDAASENAARRFIMLIDELYDRGVNIVVSAAAPPMALYHGERLKFEFARAVSRLIEMQSQEYMAGQHRP